jgi:riboflavin transporter FmnP
MVLTALLAAIATALYFLEFPLFPAASHLKLDFSDIPALLGALAFGPFAGAAIELIKNLIELLVKGAGSQMGFGNLMNFLVGCAFVLPFSALLHRRGTQSEAPKGPRLALACAAGLTVLIAVGLVMNYTITPLFFRHFLQIEITREAVAAVVGFATALNAIKGAVLCAFGCVFARSAQVKRLLR